MMSSLNKYLDRLEDLLRRVFEGEVRRNWDVARDSRDLYGRDIYVPRLDFAVGPFNISRNKEDNLGRIDEAARRYHDLISRFEKENLAFKFNNLDFNKNPRCFIAIEIENKTSIKHRLGSIINAAALGRIAIMVGVSERVLISLVRLLKYLFYLEGIGKTGWAPKNVMVIDKDSLIKILQDYV